MEYELCLWRETSSFEGVTLIRDRIKSGNVPYDNNSCEHNFERLRQLGTSQRHSVGVEETHRIRGWFPLERDSNDLILDVRLGRRFRLTLSRVLKPIYFIGIRIERRLRSVLMF